MGRWQSSTFHPHSFSADQNDEGSEHSKAFTLEACSDPVLSKKALLPLSPVRWGHQVSLCRINLDRVVLVPPGSFPGLCCRPL